MDKTFEEEIEVYKRDDDLILPLRFQKTSLKILVGIRIINYSFIFSN